MGSPPSDLNVLVASTPQSWPLDDVLHEMLLEVAGDWEP